MVAIDTVLVEFDLGPDSTVVDLAAGTGQVSRSLLHRVGAVVAVEPTPQMREQFAAVLPGVAVRDGSAEEIPLPDASVDAVIVGEAFHWFHVAAAAHEIARVLARGGGLALLWNQPTWTEHDTPWLAEFRSLLAPHRAAAGPFPAGDGQWRSELTATGLFEPLSYAESRHTQELTIAEFLAQVRSWSWFANLPHPTRTATLAEIKDLLAGHDRLLVPFRTQLYWTRRARRQ